MGNMRLVLTAGDVEQGTQFGVGSVGWNSSLLASARRVLGTFGKPFENAAALLLDAMPSWGVEMARLAWFHVQCGVELIWDAAKELSYLCFKRGLVRHVMSVTGFK